MVSHLNDYPATPLPMTSSGRLFHKYSPAGYWKFNLITFGNLLLALGLTCLTCTCYATGPSSARIYIKPVTHNDNGVVLFKAYKTIDYWGSTSDRKFSYIWLAVSANGVWEEVPHKILKQPEYTRTNTTKSLEIEERKQAVFWKTVRFYFDEFANDLDWARPPKSLMPLIIKYGFKPRPDFNQTEGNSTVTWSSTRLCNKEKCTKFPVPQRTLGKRFSSDAYKNTERMGTELVEVESKPIQNIFHHTGVALFRNGYYKIMDGKYEETDDPGDDPIGAMFDFYKREMGDRIIDFEYIDAISIVPTP